MEPTTVRFDEESLEEMDEAMERDGFHSRSQFIRWVVNRHVSNRKHAHQRLDEHDERLERLEAEVFDEE